MIVTLEDITQYFCNGDEKRYIYDKFSLSISDSEFILIYGASGCGKSTLLNIIGGLLCPCSGRVLFDQMSYYDMPVRWQEDFRAKNIGFIFQSYQLIEDLSIIDNVIISMHKLPLTRKQKLERAKDAISMLGLEKCINNKIINLSGGEQQRVAIARTIAQDSKIIICDEPTGNLDEKTGNDIVNILLSMKKNHKTVIMVTHNPNYMKLADRVIHIK